MTHSLQTEGKNDEEFTFLQIRQRIANFHNIGEYTLKLFDVIADILGWTLYKKYKNEKIDTSTKLIMFAHFGVMLYMYLTDRMIILKNILFYEVITQFIGLFAII